MKCLLCEKKEFDVIYNNEHLPLNRPVIICFKCFSNLYEKVPDRFTSLGDERLKIENIGLSKAPQRGEQ